MSVNNTIRSRAAIKEHGVIFRMLATIISCQSVTKTLKPGLPIKQIVTMNYPSYDVATTDCELY